MLTYAEQIAVEQIQSQTNPQLEYTAKEFEFRQEYDFIDFMVVPQNKIAVPVPKSFFIIAVLMELEFRETDGEQE